LHSYFHAEAGELENRINDTGDWDDDIEKQFESLLENFKKTQTY
jgi:F0F1-type ATP synthase alpha subunit